MTIMMSTTNNVQTVVEKRGGPHDVTLTKVFVGGLAWETPKESLKQHFDKYGEILEAVIISDKLTGRSKGYGFVTFKNPEAAKKACEEANPTINGRRANCNLASLGVKRQRPTTPFNLLPLSQGTNIGPRANSAAHANHVHWFYPTAGAPPPTSLYHHPHHHHQPAVPFFAYSPSPTYIAPEMTYNQKLSYTTEGSYMNGHFYGGQPIMGPNTVMPIYPLYNYYQSQTMGLPAHLYSPTTAGPLTSVPALMSKPITIAPNPGNLMQVKL